LQKIHHLPFSFCLPVSLLAVNLSSALCVLPSKALQIMLLMAVEHLWILPLAVKMIFTVQMDLMKMMLLELLTNLPLGRAY